MSEKQTTRRPKLTPPQRALLTALRRGESEAAHAKYPPVAKLLALGLIESAPQRFGGISIRITQEGLRVREALYG